MRRQRPRMKSHLKQKKTQSNKSPRRNFCFRSRRRGTPCRVRFKLFLCECDRKWSRSSRYGHERAKGMARASEREKREGGKREQERRGGRERKRREEGRVEVADVVVDVEFFLFCRRRPTQPPHSLRPKKTSSLQGEFVKRILSFSCSAFPLCGASPRMCHARAG